MTDLVPNYYQRMLQMLQQMRGLKTPGTAVQPGGGPPIIDGEFSEVPKAIAGPKAVAPWSEPYSGSPGAASSAGGAARAALTGPGMGNMWGLAGPMIMAASQGDVLNNHVPKMYASPLPATPTPPVQNGGALAPPVQPPSQNDANAIQAMLAKLNGTPADAPSPPISTSNYAPQNIAVSAPPTYPSSGGFTARPTPAPAPSPATAVGGQVPMPMARPASAPQAAPQMNFWQRNAAMMQDPTTGQFIDPMAAAQAQASFPQNGSNLINKMFGYLSNKASTANPKQIQKSASTDTDEEDD